MIEIFDIDRENGMMLVADTWDGRGTLEVQEWCRYMINESEMTI